MPRLKDTRKVMIIGSGPIIIGKTCEINGSGTRTFLASRDIPSLNILKEHEGRPRKKNNRTLTGK